MTAATRVGWCPGALRPMRSGDGLLVRVKPRGGALTFDQAAALARLAETCGNGQLDLTSRANLQIRGVSDATLDALHQGLGRIGLLDPDPEIEAVRNIVVSPLAGLDATAVADVQPLLARLDHRLASDPIFRQMPPKWSIVVDDGGSLSLDEVAADVRLVFADRDKLFIGLGGAWAPVRLDVVPDALSGLARFVAARQPARMRDLMDAVGKRALFAAAGVAETAARPARRPAVSSGALLGRRMNGLFVGVAAPFGSLCAEDLSRLVEAARDAQACDLRLTPWRVLLAVFPVRPTHKGDPGRPPLPCGEGLGVRVARNDENAPIEAFGNRATLTPYPSPQGRGGVAAAHARFVRDLDRLGMIADQADPRLQIVACTGAPGCHRATVPTRADAAKLARAIEPGPTIQVHVSGCRKGCARAASTPWTLVGRDGLYDLVRDGSAGDTPMAKGLSFADAAAWVRGAMLVSPP